VSDVGNNRIRLVDIESTQVETLVGSGSRGFDEGTVVVRDGVAQGIFSLKARE
jgi:hypothetical protein